MNSKEPKYATSLWDPNYIIAFWIKHGCLDTIQVCVDCCYLQAILTDAQSLEGLHCISEENPLASQHNKLDKPKINNTVDLEFEFNNKAYWDWTTIYTALTLLKRITYQIEDYMFDNF